MEFKLGEQVKYTDNNIEYLGMIVAKKASSYLVSIAALGKVVEVEADQISKI